MSTNSNFRKNKCWSCEFYSCKREYKKGLLFGDSVNCDNSGICSNKRSFNYYNKTVSESNYCSKYQKWGVLQAAIAREEANQERLQQLQSERLAKEEERQSLEREKYEIERERQAIAREKAELEHERWYLGLTEEERKKYDEEQVQKKAEAQEQAKLKEKESAERYRKYAIEQEMIRIQQLTKAKKKKQNLIIAIVSTFAIIFIGIPLFLYLFTYLSILFDI